MPNYHYTALDRSGNKLKGEVSAPNELAARKSIKDKGLFVVQMGLETKRFKLPSFFNQSTTQKTRVPGKELVFFTRQLATLLRSGFTLDNALAAISEQIAHPGFYDAILDLDRMVKEGKTFHESLSVYPYIFSDIFRSLVKAGEASGELPAILTKLALYLEDQAKLKTKIIATLTYPLVMLLACIGVIFVLMTYVVPNITQVILDQGKELPFATSLLINSSSFLAQWWMVILGAFLFGVFTLRQYYKTVTGRRVLDQFLLGLPLLGSLFTKVAISRFASTFAVLLRSGVEILRSMGIVKDVVGNVILQQAIVKAANNVGEGNSIAGPLGDSGVFPPIVIKMIDSGQKSGNLEDMLETIARDYDNEVESTILALTSILEPIIIIVMGSFVAFIVWAVLVPLQDMANL